MAKLINCKLCGKEISDSGVKCPNCGEYNDSKLDKVAYSFGKFLFILVGLFVFILLYSVIKG
ncbi:hypothetical protein PJV94_07020 [Aliarcobacter butzleri]|uniref:hypothetical protein n=1 Tax=Aliarcobacter butzleri TaxID=28197 RepID=UPI00263C7D66|nr:hypothetical protein [Aliarcobacter butzleri]MDN5073373.1 hypothetical protein [Aliarcobacter butzleri]MDN5121427.1 hypothetical protein [Aliarcobacter butzleri]MDN5130836.1 hypothetical protein [Aliarcobacter butzleri]